VHAKRAKAYLSSRAPKVQGDARQREGELKGP
jgi:hypothetical protein